MYQPACLDRLEDSIRGVSIQGFLIDGEGENAIVAWYEGGAIGVVWSFEAGLVGAFYTVAPRMYCAGRAYLIGADAVSLGS